MHDIGFRSMRKMFRSGIEFFEEEMLSRYTHRYEHCQTSKRGFRNFTLRTVFGRVTFPRQRIFCQTCGEWVIPLNEALGLHEELIDYIQNNWEGIVNYRDMYKAGYLIASSLAEKALDLVVAKRQKKKQSMHWTVIGADRISALRTLWLNGDWDEYWRERRKEAA